jgi:hypothetical protein
MGPRDGRAQRAGASHSASEAPHTEAIRAAAAGLEDLRTRRASSTEVLGRRHDHVQHGQVAVADLAPAGADEAPHLTHREGREACSAHEALAVLVLQAVDDLLVAAVPA